MDRAHTPWLVLVGHRPMYIDADDGAWEQGKQTTALQLQAALEGLLGRTGVDLALSGHHHSCELEREGARGGARGRARPAAAGHLG